MPAGIGMILRRRWGYELADVPMGIVFVLSSLGAWTLFLATLITFRVDTLVCLVLGIWAFAVLAFIRLDPIKRLREIDESSAREDLLITQLQHGVVGARSIAAKALAGARDAQAMESLIVALRDPDSGVRSSAAYALGDTRDRRAVEPLIAVMKDANRQVRRAAADALGAIADAGAVEAMIVALNDQDTRVRRVVAHALGEIKDLRAIEPLTAALKDDDREVRYKAQYALDTIQEGPN